MLWTYKNQYVFVGIMADEVEDFLLLQRRAGIRSRVGLIQTTDEEEDRGSGKMIFSQ